MKQPVEISAIVDGFDLTCREGVNALEREIRSRLSIYEIESFADFLHGGNFMSDAGWMRSFSGHVAATADEDRTLEDLWKRLLRDAMRSLGAAAAIEMQEAKILDRYFLTDEGKGTSLHDLTLDEIAKRIPDGVKARIDRDLQPERNKREQQASAIGGDVAKKDRLLAEGAKLLAKLTAENADLKARLAKYE